MGRDSGYTTFSSYTFEALALVAEGEWLAALGYVLGSNGLGLAATFLGTIVARGMALMGRQRDGDHRTGATCSSLFGERDHAPGRFLGKPLWGALLEYLRREGAAGATVTRGYAGYGAHSRIHTASLVDLSSDLPLVLEWVDTEERIEQLLPGLGAIIEGSGGLLTTDPVEIRRYKAHQGRD